MVSKIKISLIIRFFLCALVFDTTSPRAKALQREGQGRLPEVRLAGPCHGNFTPARISRSRPPCVIPILGAGTGRKYHNRSDRVMAQQFTKAARRGWMCARRLLWPSLDGALLHRRVLAHPRHCFPFWGLSANVFSLTGYDPLGSGVFQRALFREK